MVQIQLLGITPEQLQTAIIEGVKLQLNDLKKHFEPKTPDELLTRLEVSKMLKIDLSSVHNWTKKGILKANQIGGRVYYKRSEVEGAIVELKQ
ncbi:helix-turn-helix domain-containing protein [Arenibacter sp. BSSL-BM3]|uniref:Helix-turn-helix domain-containing protein n=1 Tax=Arenibacter arenosicollis TaxID=2762274 RepID=A0ABR7QJ89_9FLAO|nr:helix-turn-helix domain-containing protein [Arenibacter arenosicollis]MBC8767174.1 helix-turn-helix domain-containing protein [Arenibacter arenosicollis]